ncbi:MAG TPA: response regulator, partial [Candidatus Polarisedimenticolia bacterium]|nr:response regulator [Candidatus Polarisedimenticolia bacterium]
MAKVTVLIADDLKFFVETEKSYLQRGGFDVLTALSGEEAVALAAKRPPHLVLLDLEMPRMDGAAACA